MTSPSDAPLRRRALLRGVAWTAPVVGIAVAAPAIAASLQECPTLPAAEEWETTMPSGALDAETDTSTTSWQNRDGVDTWISQRNSSPDDIVQGATIFTDAELPVVAGVTYTISFEAAGQWSAESADPEAAETAGQAMQLTVTGADGGSLARTAVATRPEDFNGTEALPMSEGDPVWQTYSVTFTATQDETVTVGMSNLLRESSDTYNDDVLVRMPLVTCEV
ncbi:hypothetical protein [Brachybacterium sp. YJGR34]|uniref:hypothetical protein n=1 Tax=Brachybacterium sp. YJGR34 TaxID=2059911 RepID=UPI0013005F9F|nr:hypothetical protein [Brachybacterium sp. YJGR34]